MRLRPGRSARVGTLLCGLIATASAGAVLGAHGGTSDLVPAPTSTITRTRPMQPGTPSNPRLVIRIKGEYKYTAVATAPVQQQDLRTWRTTYDLPFLFGTSEGLYVSDLRSALSRQQSLLDTGKTTESVVGDVEKHTTVGDCSQIIRTFPGPSLEVDAVSGRTLIVALDFEDSMEFTGDPCIGDPGGITVASPNKAAGKCTWSPEKLPGLHFATQLTECITRRSTLYFPIDVAGLDPGKPVPTQTLKYSYSFAPTDNGWQNGDFSTEISWHADVSIALVTK